MRALGWLFFLVAGVSADEGVDLVTRPAPPVHDGERLSLSLSIVPRNGHHLHAEAPLVLRIDGHQARVAKGLLGRADAVDAHADVPRFEIPVVIEHAAGASITVRCTLWLCRDDRCRPVELSTDWKLAN